MGRLEKAAGYKRKGPMRFLKFPAVIFIILFVAAGCYLIPFDENTRFFALIIGINDYTDPITDLTYCVDDATEFKNALIENGWKDSEIVLLTDSSADKTTILSTLTSFAAQAGKNDYLLLYYSGHGTVVGDTTGDEPDGSDEAIVPADYISGNNTTLILDDELGEIFSGSSTQKGVFIFDACNSGGFVNKALNTGDLNARYTETTNIKGPATNGDLDITQFPVLAASGQYEFAYENSNLEHGVFTYFILQGLSGLRADADKDDYITIRELFNYAENHTESYVEYYYGFVYQHPQLRYPRDFVDILVTR
jgi:uncharacterized caspase-like protein